MFVAEKLNSYNIFDSFSSKSQPSHARIKTEKEFENELRLANAAMVADDGGFSSLPGIANLIFAPSSAIGYIKTAKMAQKIGDIESYHTSHLRFDQSLMSFGNAIGSLATYQNMVFNTISASLQKKISDVVSALGLVICAIEAFCESRGMYRQTSFRNSSLIQFSHFLEKGKEYIDKDPRRFIKELEHELSLLRNKKLSEKELKEVHEILGKALGTQFDCLRELYAKDLHNLSAALLAKSFADKYFDGQNVAKVVSLERRVGIWPCEGLDKRLKTFASDILSYVPERVEKAAQEVVQIFKTLDQQAIKKMVVYAIGLVAVIFTAISIGVSIGTGLIAIPIALSVIALLFSLTRYLLVHGLCSQSGWNFSIKACIPEEALKLVDLLFAPESVDFAKRV